MGNLDACYIPSLYPSIQLTALNAHTRKGKGGMLIFTFTFRGKLHLSLGWDREGFEPGVVEGFWKGVGEGVGEFLVSRPRREVVGRIRSRL
jgi:hypothetical protein